VYAGPKDPDVLKASYRDYEVVLDHDLGYFNGIASVLLWVLGFFERLIGNWGVAIILLTVLVRSLLFPLNRRSQTAMARYQKKDEAGAAADRGAEGPPREGPAEAAPGAGAA
jgi:YidC/Oxa1 family membrane protein insertase